MILLLGHVQRSLLYNFPFVLISIDYRRVGLSSPCLLHPIKWGEPPLKYGFAIVQEYININLKLITNQTIASSVAQLASAFDCYSQHIERLVVRAHPEEIFCSFFLPLFCSAISCLSRGTVHPRMIGVSLMASVGYPYFGDHSDKLRNPFNTHFKYKLL